MQSSRGRSRPRLTVVPGRRRRRRWSWYWTVRRWLPVVVVLVLVVVSDGMPTGWNLADWVPTRATVSRPAAGEIVGIASVIDGDTIEIHGQRIRFDGIDAPENSQVCVRGGVKERCGQRAAMFLADAVGGGTVRCEKHDVDRYGRAISTCWLGDRNLNQAMVEAGQAVAYRHFSERYVPEEKQARAAGVGVWGTEFEMPWDYRN